MLAFCTVNWYKRAEYLRFPSQRRKKMKEIDIDALDRAILGALLEDGR